MVGFGTLLSGIAALSDAVSGPILGAAQLSSSEAAAKMQTREAARQFDENMAWQREQYGRSQAWLERMSNTAHQREMEDLAAAGLNPVLTATGGAGASTPSAATFSGASPTASAQMPDYSGYSMIQRSLSDSVQGFQKALDLYIQESRLQNETELNKSQIAKNLADAANTKALSDPTRRKLEQEIETSAAQARNLQEQANLANANAYKVTSERAWIDPLARAKVASAQSMIRHQREMEEIQKTRNKILGWSAAGRFIGDMTGSAADIFTKGASRGARRLFRGGRNDDFNISFPPVE